VLEAYHCGERELVSAIKQTVREKMWCKCGIN
jgi:hypothetical protein